MEEWRTCPRCDEYEISNKGRIRKSSNGYILKPYIGERGYEQITIRDTDGNRRCVYIHSLVASAFIFEEANAMTVEHIDGNKLNNDASNLRFVSRDTYFTNLYSRDEYNNNHLKKKIRCVETGEVFSSIGEASDILNIGYRSISRCVNNPYTQTREGYHFESLN